jgi:hypothetical protein
MGAMLLADAESYRGAAGRDGGSGGRQPLSTDQARQLVGWVRARADAVRREAYERVR